MTQSTTPTEPGLPTEPAPRDDTGLINSIAREREQLVIERNDPNGLYRNRPDLIERRLMELRALELRAGLTPPPPVTAESMAAAALQDRWPESPVSETPAATIAEQIEIEKALHPAERQEHVNEMITRFGADEYEKLPLAQRAPAARRREQETALGRAFYDQLVANAKLALTPGAPVPDGLISNRFALTTLAAKGTYLAERSKQLAALPKV